MITIGIDIGSTATKSVMLNDKREVLASDVVLTGGNNVKSADLTLNNLLKKTNLERGDIDKIVATGYGRDNVNADKAISEITCHAKGMFFTNPNIRTILDIGGQDSKAISIDEEGNVLNFLMNDKCAAGCGRFLEIIARSLNVKLEEMSSLSEQATDLIRITSMCSVFAETEVVSLVASGCTVPNILKGIHNSIAERTISLMLSVGIVDQIGMSGGVAKNKEVIRALEKNLNKTISVPDEPQIIGALGAACIGQTLC